MHTANSIPLTAVQSSQLAAIGHCPKTETLAIQFLRKGVPDAVYHYGNFTAQEFTAFASAESVGSHFYKHIKPHADKHPYTNMGAPEAVAPAAAPLSKELLAMLLHGRQSGSEITKEEEVQAKAAGLVVIFGASDDLMELRGAVNDEFNCYDGGTAHIDAAGLLPERENIDDDMELVNYHARRPLANTVEALWCAEEGCTWTYRTTVPHATFEIMEDDLVYCRGIVISVADLGGVAA
ncbi:MAG: KTSC domain-containing protein [Burkholderiaceae bacterium]|nr:KTSC domain-containing protein [Burkholderiaceae bacterium]